MASLPPSLLFFFPLISLFKTSPVKVEEIFTDFLWGWSRGGRLFSKSGHVVD